MNGKWIKRAILLTSILAVIALIIGLAFAVYIYSAISSAIPVPENDTQAASIISQVKQHGYTAFSLASVIPLIAIAGVIITVLFMYFMRKE